MRGSLARMLSAIAVMAMLVLMIVLLMLAASDLSFARRDLSSLDMVSKVSSAMDGGARFRGALK